MDTSSHFVDGFVLPLLAAIAAGAVLAAFFGGLKWSYKKHLAITLPLVLLPFAIAWITIERGEPAPPLTVAGTIVDDSDNKPLGHARVSLDDGSVSYVSEDNGNFLLDLTGKRKRHERARIHVTKDGYTPYDATVTVPADGVEIPLHHL